MLKANRVAGKQSDKKNLLLLIDLMISTLFCTEIYMIETLNNIEISYDSTIQDYDYRCSVKIK